MTRILVVDDERTVAGALARGLRAEGFEVDVAHDGDDGFSKASEGIHDLVILDVMLPGRDGLRLCRDIRAAGHDVPILVLTAGDGVAGAVVGTVAGADDQLTKPFAFVVVLARIRALLGRPRVAAPAAFEFGGLRLDPATGRCRRGDREVELTARESAVLGLLMRRAPEPVPAGDIIDDVWSRDYTGAPDIVEVYVQRLRRKLDGPSGARTIATVRDLGYRLDPEG